MGLFYTHDSDTDVKFDLLYNNPHVIRGSLWPRSRPRSLVEEKSCDNEGVWSLHDLPTEVWASVGLSWLSVWSLLIPPNHVDTAGCVGGTRALCGSSHRPPQTPVPTQDALQLVFLC